MLLPKPADAVHKAWLYTVLTEIADDVFLSSVLRFKGGTCASMLGWLDRFSVDLDFDLIDETKVKEVRKSLEKIFKKLGLEIKDQSTKVPQYFLKYPSGSGANAKQKTRNTLKLDITFPPEKFNDYEPFRFKDIDRVLLCQTAPSMFANKLIAAIERFEKNGAIAGRDLFDIHTFFMNGVPYKSEIIEDRRKTDVRSFLKELKTFIEEKVTQTVLDQDLNMLLPPDRFQRIRKLIKPQILTFLEEEIKR